MAGFERRQSAGYMTAWAGRLFAQTIDRHLKPLGLKSGQLPVLFALASKQPLSQRELTETAAVEQPTMANLLVRMEREGLILKSPDPNDGRSMLISLSLSAQEKLPSVRNAITDVNAKALSSLSEVEQEAYFSALNKIVSVLSTELE